MRGPSYGRCRIADLRLLAAALSRADYLAAQLTSAHRAGDAPRVRRIKQELALLAPGRPR